MNFCSRFLRLSVVLWCRETPQDAVCLFGVVREIKMARDWLGCVLVIFLGTVKVFANRSPSHLPVSPIITFCITWSYATDYAIDDIGEGIRETIGDLNRSLRSRHFVSVVDEWTSLVSWLPQDSSHYFVEFFTRLFWGSGNHYSKRRKWIIELKNVPFYIHSDKGSWYRKV